MEAYSLRYGRNTDILLAMTWRQMGHVDSSSAHTLQQARCRQFRKRVSRGVVRHTTHISPPPELFCSFSFSFSSSFSFSKRAFSPSVSFRTELISTCSHGFSTRGCLSFSELALTKCKMSSYVSGGSLKVTRYGFCEALRSECLTQPCLATQVNANHPDLLLLNRMRNVPGGVAFKRCCASTAGTNPASTPASMRASARGMD